MFPTKVALFALFSLFLAGEKKEDDVGVLHSQYTGWKRGEGGAFVTQSRESRSGFCRDFFPPHFFLLFPPLVTTKTGALLTLVQTHDRYNVQCVCKPQRKLLLLL